MGYRFAQTHPTAGRCRAASEQTPACTVPDRQSQPPPPGWGRSPGRRAPLSRGPRWRAMGRRAAHHDDVGAPVAFPPVRGRPASMAGESTVARCGFGNAHAERALAGEPVREPPSGAGSAGGGAIDLAAMAMMPKRSARAPARSARRISMMPNTRAPRGLAAHLQAGIRKARDHEGRRLRCRLSTRRRSGSVTCSTSRWLSIPNGPSASVAQTDRRAGRRGGKWASAASRPAVDSGGWNSD